ncbi:MAG: 1-acyl-sn-glycerol-3-phosphate acyltransferase [Actinobacteria bacterium HGW-Actinobacteria-4]|nr:MAG: 1-acyl-sn-glycerol-3-phosphate acyltransferase [Actinobacteria bacterium HGW-Actinobacteria-4]
MPTTPSRGYRAAACFLRAVMTPITRKDWHGAEHLPKDQGFIAVSNHVTYADPITFAHFLYLNGHPPRFLAKAPLFTLPVIGRIITSLDQIPVYRGSVRAKDAVDKGVEVLARGDMIALFPEGTLTRDPDLWPMVARTGAARMALETGVPVIPVAQWGAHRLLGRYKKLLKPFPPKRITVIAGPPIDLDEFRGQPIDNKVLRGATDRIMATLTTMVEDIRGESAPAEPFNMHKDAAK